MRSFFLVAFAAIFLVIPAHNVIAQSPEMPVPGLVLKDADGKVMGQVFDVGSASNEYRVTVVFSIQGKPAGFEVYRNGGHFGEERKILFTGPGCIGDEYVGWRNVERYPLELWAGTWTIILGPDKDDGTYRVFRSTTFDWETISVLSYYDRHGECVGTASFSPDAFPVQEVLPNPLEGFHGPTTANPERVLTIEGGTRLQ